MDLDFDVSGWLFPRKVCRDALSDCGEVHVVTAQFRAPDAGKLEKVVDELSHPLRPGADTSKVIGSLFV